MLDLMALKDHTTEMSKKKEIGMLIRTVEIASEMMRLRTIGQGQEMILQGVVQKKIDLIGLHVLVKMQEREIGILGMVSLGILQDLAVMMIA